jgi:hypothetical protein
MLMLAFLYGSTAQAQITRGAQPAEIYISTDWYIDNLGKIHYAIFHSTDNGEHISLKYENLEVPPPGEMQVGRVLGDATPGALYNWGWNELWVSFDYGVSWEYKEIGPDHIIYLSGQSNGTIFKIISAELSQSDDFGNDFTVITNPISCPICEPGYYLGEFYGINGNIGTGLFLDHTLDFANTYTEITIDSAVAFWQIGGYYPQISRGTEPGKLYLVSWWPDYHYKIFHSVDTGYTWAEKYESDYINQYFWEVQYTAGRQPGSFYVMRSTVAPAGDHIWLYIDYSSDYGVTFITYFHDLDSTITSVNSIKQPDFKLSNYPNPFSDRTTMNFYLPNSCNDAVLNIYDINGILIRQYDVYGKKVQQWDGCNSSGITVKSGLYFYQIKTNELLSPLNKLLFVMD